MSLIYKILSRDMWARAQHDGMFKGAAIDLTDGYIHLSTAAQAEETVRRHFVGQDELLLIAFDPADFVETLRWEASRGGALFPHIYGNIKTEKALWVKELALENGHHIFPEGWDQ